MTTKQAQIVVFMVEVLCPHCGEAQPNPDNGGFPWTPAELKQHAGGKRECVSCDEPFLLFNQSKVSNPEGCQ